MVKCWKIWILFGSIVIENLESLRFIVKYFPGLFYGYSTFSGDFGLVLPQIRSISHVELQGYDFQVFVYLLKKRALMLSIVFDFFKNWRSGFLVLDTSHLYPFIWCLAVVCKKGAYLALEVRLVGANPEDFCINFRLVLIMGLAHI